MKDKDIFKKIRPQEKKIIIEALIHDSIEMLAKGKSDSVFHFKAVKFGPDENLQVELIPDSDPVTAKDLIVVNFTYQNDRYFFQSYWTTGAEIGTLAIECGCEFFHLQRRSSPRLELPGSYPGQFNISEFRGQPVFFQCRVLNFGTGGLRLKLEEKGLNVVAGDVFRGFLRIGKKNPFNLTCQIRHSASHPATGQILGVQFVELSSIDQNRLLVIFMDLQRDLFTKRIGKGPTKNK